MGSRFRKQDESTEVEQPTSCVCNGCWLHPTKAVAPGGIRLYCHFHNQSDNTKERDRKTLMINRNESLFTHFFQHLNNKTPVDCKLAEEAGKHPGIVGNGDMAIWNKKPEENYMQYRQRYWFMLVKLVQTGAHALPVPEETAA